MLLPLCGWAEKQGYAVFNKSKGTLTFKYGEKPEGDNVYDTDNTSIYRVEWELTFEYVTKVVFESSFAKARPTSTAHWFSTMPYIGYMVSPLKEIVGLKYLNTSQVTNMANMFLGCNKLTSLDVSHFDTSKVTDMSNMFSGCAGLKSLDLSNFNTSKVESFGNMFERCSSLSSLNVSSFNTSKSTHMGGMFIYCSSLKKLDVRNFNTSKVTDMSYMFCGCTGLTSLDLSNFNTSKVDDMYSMFMDSSNLTELDLSSFNTSKVTRLALMFGGCTALKTIYVSDKWSTASVEEGLGDFVFTECTKLVGGKGTKFDANHTGSEYARIDGGPDAPGYLTNKNGDPGPETVTITAKSYTITYGDPIPTFEYTTKGPALKGTPTLTCDATSASPVGTYVIKVEQGSVTNEKVSLIDGTLTITEAPLTISAGNYTKKQGEENPTFTPTYKGFKNNETEAVLTKQPTVTTTAKKDSPAGKYEVTVCGAEAQNYEITYENGTLTIEAAPEPDEVTITAKSYTITYGDPIPTLEYTTKGAALKGTPTLTCDATSASPVGTYDIKVGMGSVTNEKVSLVDGTLTITKAPLTISAGNYTKKLGEENPTFTPTYKGFKNNETEAVLTKQPTVTTTATKDSPAGTYDVTVSGAEAQNYEITYKNGTLTIESRPIEKGEFIYDNVVYIYGVDNGLFAEVKAGDDFHAGSPDASGEVKILPWVVVNANRYMVISIDGDAFNGNKKITRVVIPGSVQSIWGHAFKDCTSLEEVVIEKPEADMPSKGLEKFGKSGQFAGCTSLRSINLPSTLTNLGAKATFEGCSSLTSITIPAGVAGIPDNAFTNCTALKEVQIKGSLDIGPEAFMNCTSLESIDLSNGIKEIIREYAFKSCTSLKTVVLPTDGKYQIGVECFKNCTSLESITIPAAVTEIGRNVCEKCTGMTKAVIERSSKTWEPSALFLNCTSLKEASIGWEGRLPSDIFKGCTSLESVTLTKYTDEIGWSAFEGCSSLKELLLSERIKAVENSAFAYCSSLESIAFTDKLTSLGARVFYHCTSMKVIDLSECTGLTIANTYRNEDNDNLVFSGVPKETVILLPNSGGLIENEDVSYEFQEGNTVAIADGSEAAGEYEIPEAIEHDGVEYPVAAIEAEAFKDNTNLTQVSIPGSIQSIGEEAFAGCINLSAIYAFATEPIPLGAGVTGTRGEGSSVFAGVDLENCVLYVPKGCVEKYRSAEGWGEFAHIVEMDMTAIWTVRYDEQEVDKYYNLHGQQVAHPGKGVYIKNGKKILKR